VRARAFKNEARAAATGMSGAAPRAPLAAVDVAGLFAPRALAACRASATRALQAHVNCACAALRVSAPTLRADSAEALLAIAVAAALRDDARLLARELGERASANFIYDGTPAAYWVSVDELSSIMAAARRASTSEECIDTQFVGHAAELDPVVRHVGGCIASAARVASPDALQRVAAVSNGALLALAASRSLWHADGAAALYPRLS